jgi:hypothetical protein
LGPSGSAGLWIICTSVAAIRITNYDSQLMRRRFDSRFSHIRLFWRRAFETPPKKAHRRFKR